MRLYLSGCGQIGFILLNDSDLRYEELIKEIKIISEQRTE